MGTVKLSLIGKGKASASIPMAAPIKAFDEGTYKEAPTKAIKNPKMDPSKCFPLLKGIMLLPRVFPKRAANPSPRATIAMEA